MNADLGTIIDPIAFAADVLDGMPVAEAIANNPGGTYTREAKGKKCLYLRVRSGTLQPRTSEGQGYMQKLIDLGAAKPYDLEQQDQAAEQAAALAAEDTKKKIRKERRTAPTTNNPWADKPEEPAAPGEQEEPAQGWTMPEGSDE